MAAGHVPFVVIGTAGSVSTGAVDPLPRSRASAKSTIWFHVDGAYGGVRRQCRTCPTICAR